MSYRVSRPASVTLIALSIVLVACTRAPPPEPGPAPSPAPVTTPANPPAQRALVLGGGGPVGRAWEVGILKAFQDAGVDVNRADLMVGTSSGANLATQIRSGMNVSSLYDTLMATGNSPPPPPSGAEPGFDPAYAAQTQEPARDALRTAPEVAPEIRKQVGQMALVAPRMVPEEVAIRNNMAPLGDVRSWPVQPLKIAAGDVTDGTIRFFDRTQDVPIERALAASNALPGQIAPITIGDRRYMDGFVGGANIDAAAGTGILLVLWTGAAESPVFQAEVARARSRGSQVFAIAPDPDGRAAMGPNNQDLTKRAPSVQTGLRQGKTLAAEAKAFWKKDG